MFLMNLCAIKIRHASEVLMWNITPHYSLIIGCVIDKIVNPSAM